MGDPRLPPAREADHDPWPPPRAPHDPRPPLPPPHPNNLSTLLLDPKELAELLLLAVPLVVAAGGIAVGLIAGGIPWAAMVSAAICGYVLVGVYEWTHYLIHTAYRPRSRAYRRIWRNHRLHHFKNEHYWHGITNTVADRVLGTEPDQRDVPRSPTARTLDQGPRGVFQSHTD
jgi:hypothetical protein